MSGASQRLFQRQPEVESAPLEDECILYHPGENRFLRLNRTASFIWRRIEAPATAEEIAGELVREFSGVDGPDAVTDIRAALERMVSMSVVEASDPGSPGEPDPGGNP